MAKYPFHVNENWRASIQLYWSPINAHLSRARLPGGYFIDRETARMCRTNGYRYEIFLSGGSPTGGALFICGDDTVRMALTRLESCRAPKD